MLRSATSHIDPVSSLVKRRVMGILTQCCMDGADISNESLKKQSLILSGDEIHALVKGVGELMTRVREVLRSCHPAQLESPVSPIALCMSTV